MDKTVFFFQYEYLVLFRDEPIGDYLQTEKFVYLNLRCFSKTYWKNENYLLYRRK